MAATEPTFYKFGGPLFPPDDPDVLSYIGKSGRIHAQRSVWDYRRNDFAPLATRIGMYSPRPDQKLTICGLTSKSIFAVHTGDIQPCGSCWGGHQVASKYLMSPYWGRTVEIPEKEKR